MQTPKFKYLKKTKTNQKKHFIHQPKPMYEVFLRTILQSKPQNVSAPLAGLRSLRRHTYILRFKRFVSLTVFEDSSASQKAENKYASRGIAIPPPSHFTCLFPLSLRTAPQNKSNDISEPHNGMRSRLRSPYVIGL